MTGVMTGVSNDAWGPDVDRTMPEFAGMFGSIGHFFSNAAKVAGKEIGHVSSGIQAAGGAIDHAIQKVPVVGAPLHTVLSASYHTLRAPVDLTIDVAIRGKRIDRAVLGKLHEQVSDLKAEAPYAQMVCSVVPGVGSGVSAAIGAASALANGQPIDKALLAAVISAVPGGPLAQTAASAAAAGVEAAVHGQKLDVASVTGTLVNSLPIPAAAKNALTAGIHMTGDLAAGKPVSASVADTLVRQGLSALPPAVRDAFHTGLATSAAQALQAVRAAHLQGIQGKLIESGIQLGKSLPVVGEARRLVGPGTRGFDLAHGLVSQRAQLFDILRTRHSLSSPHDLKGFDMALATRIGLVAHPPDSRLSPAAQAGRAIAHGTHGMLAHENRAEILAALHAHPSASVGARVAETHIVAQHVIWPIRVVRTLASGARMLLRKM